MLKRLSKQLATVTLHRTYVETVQFLTSKKDLDKPNDETKSKK